jgi:hypothetical protein
LPREYSNRLEKVSDKWEIIKDLSKLESESYLSKASYEYFKRPLPSKFLFSEKLGLLSFNSCYPLPGAFWEYGNVNLKITIHSSVCPPPEDNFVIEKMVPFYYV